jgi:hypothetical protein
MYILWYIELECLFLGNELIGSSLYTCMGLLVSLCMEDTHPCGRCFCICAHIEVLCHRHRNNLALGPCMNFEGLAGSFRASFYRMGNDLLCLGSTCRTGRGLGDTFQGRSACRSLGLFHRFGRRLELNHMVELRFLYHMSSLSAEQLDMIHILHHDSSIYNSDFHRKVFSHKPLHKPFQSIYPYTRAES